MSQLKKLHKNFVDQARMQEEDNTPVRDRSSSPPKMPRSRTRSRSPRHQRPRSRSPSPLAEYEDSPKKVEVTNQDQEPEAASESVVTTQTTPDDAELPTEDILTQEAAIPTQKTEVEVSKSNDL